ncbi:MAG: hypothetical protein WCK35_26065, partial [Chloroflexota bacterium]
INFHQAGQDYFQGDAVQGILGLFRTHKGLSPAPRIQDNCTLRKVPRKIFGWYLLALVSGIIEDAVKDDHFLFKLFQSEFQCILVTH